MIVAAIRDQASFSFMIVASVVIVGPLVAEKLHVPGLVGLLVGGAVMGPNMLNVLNDFSSLTAFGDIGVLYLVFLAGLGLDMPTFMEHRAAVFTFGVITATVPWVLGTGVSLLAGYDTKTAVLIGSFWASFTLVSYEVVTKYRLTRNASMAATVGASSITDTIGLVALAVIVGSETGDGSGVVLVFKIAGGLALLAGYCFVLLPTLVRWFFAGLGQERELRFMMVLVGLTSSAVVAETLGIEGLIGAFFAGLGLNRLVPNQSPLMERTSFFGNALFIPVFLISVGLLVDPSVMFQGSTLLTAAGLAAALLVGKAAAAWITGRIFGYSGAEVGLMFSLSSAQAAATLASTVIGLQIGLYGDVVVNAVMVVIVVSLFVSGLGSSYYAPKVVPFGETSRRLGDAIIVPVSPEADESTSLWLAGRIAEPDGGILVPVVVATKDPEVIAARRNELEQVRQTLHGLGLTGDPELRVARSIADGIDRAALERDASLVLLTWRGATGFRRLMLGGTNDEIAAVTDRPILVAALAGPSFERVVVSICKGDLAPALLVDTQMAFDLADRIAGPRINLTFGPVDGASLAAVGIEVPERAIFLWGDPDRSTWLDGHADSSDVVIFPKRGNPSSAFDGLTHEDRSYIAVATRLESHSYSSEGALGVTTPRL